MPVGDAEPTQTFEHVLEPSKVDAQRSAGVLKSHHANSRTVKAATVKAALSAAQRLGAKVHRVEPRAFNHPVAEDDRMTACRGDTALTGMGLHDGNDGLRMDARAFGGSFPFSTSPGTEVGGGRKTQFHKTRFHKTPCHMDIPPRHCDVLLDGRAAVRSVKSIEPVAA